MQEKLLILRKRNSLNQEFMADLLGISYKQYGKKENGKAVFNGDEMFKIAEYFNMKIDDIFLPSYHQIGDIKNN